MSAKIKIILLGNRQSLLAPRPLALLDGPQPTETHAIAHATPHLMHPQRRVCYKINDAHHDYGSENEHTKHDVAREIGVQRSRRHSLFLLV